MLTHQPIQLQYNTYIHIYIYMYMYQSPVSSAHVTERKGEEGREGGKGREGGREGGREDVLVVIELLGL